MGKYFKQCAIRYKVKRTSVNVKANETMVKLQDKNKEYH